MGQGVKLAIGGDNLTGAAGTRGELPTASFTVILSNKSMQVPVDLCILHVECWDYTKHLPVQVWVHEQADGRLDIVDGKQRITSLLSFLDGIFPRNQQRFNLEANPTQAMFC